MALICLVDCYRHHDWKSNKYVDQKRWHHCQKCVKLNYVPLPNALWSPWTVMVVSLNANVTVVTVNSPPFHQNVTSFAFPFFRLFLIFIQRFAFILLLLGRDDNTRIADGNSKVWEAGSATNNEGREGEVRVVSCGEDHSDDEEADNRKDEKSWKEACI